MEKNHQHGLTGAGEWGVFAALEELTSSVLPDPFGAPGGVLTQNRRFDPICVQNHATFCLGEGWTPAKVAAKPAEARPPIGFCSLLWLSALSARATATWSGGPDL